MANRTTQTGVREISQPNSPARPTQTAIRAISQPDPYANLTQTGIRVLRQNISEPLYVRDTQIGIRVLSSFYSDNPSVVRLIYWSF